MEVLYCHLVGRWDSVEADSSSDHVGQGHPDLASWDDIVGKMLDNGGEGIPEAIAVLDEDRDAPFFSVLPSDGGDVAADIQDISHGVS